MVACEDFNGLKPGRLVQTTKSRSKPPEIPLLHYPDAHSELQKGFLATSTFQNVLQCRHGTDCGAKRRVTDISAFDGELMARITVAYLLLLRGRVPILIRITFYVFISCNRILTRRCAKRFQPVGLRHLAWQPLVIDEQQEQNSIEGWEGSQILSATLPLIYMTDIKGTEDHWPPATWLSSKAVHHFIQERVRTIRANMCFARRAWRYLSSQSACHACMRVMEFKQKYIKIRQDITVFYITPETGGLRGCCGVCLFFCFFFPPDSTAPAKHTESNPAVRQGFPRCYRCCCDGIM